MGVQIREPVFDAGNPAARGPDRRVNRYLLSISRHSGLVAVQLARHLDHRTPKPRASEQPLSGFVPLRRRHDDPRRAARLERRHYGFKQQPTDAVPAMVGVDHDVVEDPRRPAQRHVIGPLDAGVAVTEHLAVPLRDEEDDARLPDLPPDERGVGVLRPRRGRDEALRVEVVVHPNEQRAESADGRDIRTRRGPSRPDSSLRSSRRPLIVTPRRRGSELEGRDGPQRVDREMCDAHSTEPLCRLLCERLDEGHWKAV